MSKPTVYILLSGKDGRTYLGSTTDLTRRLSEHANGYVIATRNRRPLTLIYTESYETITEARARELYLKTGAGRRQLRKILDTI